MGRRSPPEQRPATPPESRALPRPFLKWAGGKARLLPQIWPHLPARFGTFVEPFMGGAAMFFALRPHKALLADVNPELVDCYLAVRDQVEQLIEALAVHTHDHDHYYEVRAQDPLALPLVERAARTIFLNRTGYNGLYRVNRSGRFNVPFGRYKNPLICDAANLRACSAALASADLRVLDFSAACAHAKRGDLVYMDPPYVPLSPTASFTAYVPGGFGWSDQERLAEVFGELAARGVHVLQSNADVAQLRKLYKGFRISTVKASRAISANAGTRGKINEVLILGG